MSNDEEQTEEIHYQLKMVYVNKKTNRLTGDVCTIGTFKSEEELIKWAEENKGELAKA